jgi:hypothetical protein
MGKGASLDSCYEVAIDTVSILLAGAAYLYDYVRVRGFHVIVIPANF